MYLKTLLAVNTTMKFTGGMTSGWWFGKYMERISCGLIWNTKLGNKEDDRYSLSEYPIRQNWSRVLSVETKEPTTRPLLRWVDINFH
jgi:hypothetical protein